jgi:hypothetical protein
MKLFLTLLCIVVITLAAAVLVAVDLLLRWLPVLVVAAAVIAAVKSSRRRHPQARGAIEPSAVVNVPDATAFAAVGVTTAHMAPGPAHQPSPPFARRSARVVRGEHAAPWRVVVDGTVISEDGHRG